MSIDYLLDNDDAPYANDMVDFENFVRHGNYTLCARYPTEKERRLLGDIVKAIMSYTQNEKD